MGDYVRNSAPSMQPKESRETVSSLLAELGDQLDSLAKLHSHLDAIGDALEGPRPQEVASNEPDTPIASVVENLKRKRRTLNMLIRQCQDASARIENAIR